VAARQRRDPDTHLSCDEHCRVQGLGPDADVVAAGDVTAWFSRRPVPPRLPEQVWINQPVPEPVPS